MTIDPNILIVEDELSIVELLSYTLHSAGMKTTAATTAAQAIECLQRQRPHLMLLDWMLPDLSGLRLLGRLRNSREFQDMPVIMLTARATEEDRILGLDTGADDYMTKPFSPRELASRVKALLRRKMPEQTEVVLRAGAIELDPANVTVRVAGTRIDIGQAEFKLLKFLLAHPERVFSRAQLLDKVWGLQVAIEERTVDVHVLRLRKALGSAHVQVRTMRGEGYLLARD
ncbi:MAG TPA: response regulator [Noviherbaspirillum sp.]|uniref:response regulator n=1 Tax=Noviherbaspirillum sp. TaxID=1926288 RepID=UPI002B4A402A|nr:response regulator [Noviherbaspirillum sp.]HJV84618.1 response regulator [Noviherbaspirillum sp.]